jgi:hypothetical protein
MQIQYRQQLNELIEYFKLPKVVCEAGCAEGHFTKDILKWDFDKLYLIDNWANIPGQSGDGGYPDSWHQNNYRQILEKVRPFGDRVTVLKGLTTNMAQYIPDKSIGILYVDACHEEMCVKSDLEVYFPKVVDGGIISCHDFLNLSYGVNKAVKEFCAGRFEINLIPDEEEAMASCWFRKM